MDFYKILLLKYGLQDHLKGKPSPRGWSWRQALYQAGAITNKTYAGREGVEDAIKDLGRVIRGEKVWKKK